MGRCIRNNIFITLIVLILTSCCVMEAHAVTVNFSIDTFGINNTYDTEMLDTIAILDGYCKIYKPAESIEAENMEKVKLLAYCEQLNILEGKLVAVKAVYHGDRVDWLYVEDPDGAFSGWVDGGQFYILPDGIRSRKATNLDRDEILKASGDGYGLSDEMENVAAFVNVKTEEGFTNDTQLSEEEQLRIVYGFNKKSIDTSGVFYDTTDKYQIGMTVAILIVLILVTIYTYSSLWGEVAEDAMATSIASAVTVLVSLIATVFLIDNIIGITNSNYNLDVLQSIVVTSPILMGIFINGFVLAEMDRTGKPLKYSICLYGTIYSMLISILLIYNKVINPQPFSFLTSSRLFYSAVDINSVMQIEIIFTVVINCVFILIAVINRYSYSYSFDKQSQNAVKVKELMEALMEETYQLNEYLLPKKYRKPRDGYLSHRYYKDGLPTLNDLLKRLR